MSFTEELTGLLNKHGKDNDCFIPDFLLADHIQNYINNLGSTNKKNRLMKDGSSDADQAKESPTRTVIKGRIVRAGMIIEDKGIFNSGVMIECDNDEIPKSAELIGSDVEIVAAKG